MQKIHSDQNNSGLKAQSPGGQTFGRHSTDVNQEDGYGNVDLQKTMSDNKENQSQYSGTTSTGGNFQKLLNSGTPGIQIWNYVQSSTFGHDGESTLLIENINEFITKLTFENKKLESENSQLQKANDQYRKMIVDNTNAIAQCENITDQVATDLTALMQEYESMNNGETKFAKVDKEMAIDMSVMIMYVKELTEQIINLRRRTKEAEAVINQLRKSGEKSVEGMLDELFTLKRRQEQLDNELADIQAQVQQKEALIKLKEDEKSEKRTLIEDDRRAHEEKYRSIGQQIEDQKQLIEHQRKHLNELQVLNEHTQAHITNAARDLSKKIADKEGVLIQMSEEEQATVKLLKRNFDLKEQILSHMPSKNQAQDVKPGDKTQETEEQKRQRIEETYSKFYPSYTDKVRSKNAFFKFEKKEPHL